MTLGTFLATWFAVSVVVSPAIGTLLHRCSSEAALAHS